MTARARRGACALVLLAAALAACGAEPADVDAVAPDSLLAEALVLLHLAEARAAVAGEPADSLRTAAYALAHSTTGLDSAAVAQRLDAALQQPAEAAALYRLVTRRLEATPRPPAPDDRR